MNWRSRIQLSTIAIIFTIMLGFLALGFAGVAAFTVLSLHFTAAVAALLTAAIYLFIALLITASVVWINKPQQTKSKCKDPAETSLEEIEAMADRLAHPALTALIKEHPGKSAIATLVAGVIVGYSEEARTMLKSFSQQQTDNSP